MNIPQGVRAEVGNYLILTQELKAQFTTIDDETLRDTAEGVSNLPELLEAIIRSSLEDGVFIFGLKERLEAMQERMSRFKNRQERKRALVSWAMNAAGIARLQAPDFTVSVRTGAPSLEVTDESRIPGEFFVYQPPRLDRAGLTTALKRGQAIDGAALVTSEASISVRVR